MTEEHAQEGGEEIEARHGQTGIRAEYSSATSGAPRCVSFPDVKGHRFPSGGRGGSFDHAVFATSFGKRMRL